MDLLLTADQHFGHKKIIEYCNRPFKNIEEMEVGMKYAWNERAMPESHVVVVGDFAWGGKRWRHVQQSVLSSLRGRKTLVVGNHDAKHVRQLGWNSVVNELMWEHRFQGEPVLVLITHHPMPEKRQFLANKTGRTVVNLHGHEHGAGPKRKFMLDVGVDSVGYYPVTMEWAVSKALGAL